MKIKYNVSIEYRDIENDKFDIIEYHNIEIEIIKNKLKIYAENRLKCYTLNLENLLSLKILSILRI